MQSCVSHVLFCLALWSVYTSWMFSQKLSRYCSSLIELRMRLKEDPLQFWKYYCQRNERHIGRTSAGWESSASFVGLQCRQYVRWRIHGRWPEICQQNGGKPVFSPRHYRIGITCYLRYDNRDLLLGHSEWKIFR